MHANATIIPCLRYTDAPSAIDFLCRAFGFERQAVYADPQNPSIIMHAQLVQGRSMLMLGSARDDEAHLRYGWKTTQEAGGITQSIYVVVEDIDTHYARAKAAGATIFAALHDNVGYPGRGYDVRDPEGNHWSFGTYDPWAE